MLNIWIGNKIVKNYYKYMEDRIQINGTWYVKEETSKEETTPGFTFNKMVLDELELIHNVQIVYEDENYCIEFNALFDPQKDKYSMPDITITNKRSVPNIIINWDHDNFLIGLCDLNKDCIRMALEDRNVDEICLNIIINILQEARHYKYI